jgi:two-component system sensor histidine kinase PilS (NtrC family)
VAVGFLANDNLSQSRRRPALPTDNELNRRILVLVAGFRLLLAAGLVLLASLQSEPMIVGGRYPIAFLVLTCLYSIAAVVIALAVRGDAWRPAVMAWLQLLVDTFCIVLIVYTSGATRTGIENLLAVFVVAIGMTLPARSAYFAAAVAALAILFEQSVSFLDGVAPATDFIAAGSLGAIMLVLAVAVQPLVRYVGETAELARQQRIDLRNLAELNDYIIQNLREAILVIDEGQKIRLLNQTAIDMIGSSDLQAGDALKTAIPQLHAILSDWREDKLDLAREIPNFLSADGTTTLSAHFAPLSSDARKGPVLIFVEDASLLENRVQQSKLAALGRLSASIAHEIRNPVGALSHAAQLLGESSGLDTQDRRFIDIIRTNSRRVSEIIDNILQLSRREGARPQRMQLDNWMRKFVNEFTSTLELYEGQISIAHGQDVEVRMDPSHLHQIAWNLSENAVKYASEVAGAIAVEIRYGRLPGNNRPFLEISDHGPGIPPDMEEAVFEPFATGRSGGTGLGLYICRELCERNGASLRYRSRSEGGSTFQIMFADPNRWEQAECTVNSEENVSS